MSANERSPADELYFLLRPVRGEAIRRLAQSEPLQAVELANTLDKELDRDNLFLDAARGCPLERAEALLESLAQVLGPRLQYSVAVVLEDVRRILVDRLAPIDPPVALGLALGIRDDTWREYALEELVQRGALSSVGIEQGWPWWVKIADRVAEHARRARMFRRLLIVASRRPNAERREAVCDLLERLALGPCEPFLDSLDRAVSAAVCAVPNAAQRLGMASDRLASFFDTRVFAPVGSASSS
jgi:hypothetical protein